MEAEWRGWRQRGEVGEDERLEAEGSTYNFESLFNVFVDWRVIQKVVPKRDIKV